MAQEVRLISEDRNREEKVSWTESAVYLRQIAGLWPGRRVPVFQAHQIHPGDIGHWKDVELTLLIEEGRRQIDRQAADLERVRTRSQFLFTTGMGLQVVVLGSIRTIALAGSIPIFIIWVISLIVALLSTLGSIAIVVARKELGTIDAALLSQIHGSVRRELASAYSRAISAGENTLATQITVYRDSVFLLLSGGIIFAVSWILATVHFK